MFFYDEMNRHAHELRNQYTHCDCWKNSLALILMVGFNKRNLKSEGLYS